MKVIELVAFFLAAVQLRGPELDKIKLGTIQIKVDGGCCFHFCFLLLGQYSIWVAQQNFHCSCQWCDVCMGS